ncbi:MAG: FAD-dependent monooxygenase [Bacteroidetes bacterium]|nr:FAD-dependent monooxygenase [Bacteroidota bacterium]
MSAGCLNNCPNCKCSKSAIIIGAGLVGSLWAVYLSKAGYKVDVYERRPDMRLTKMSAGKSINLATSYRGWKALDEVGIGDEIRKIAIPMYGRTLHHQNGETKYQPYGNGDQAIYSVSRGEINAKLMSIAEENPFVHIQFNAECVHIDFQQDRAQFRDTLTGEITDTTADVIFATDGAFSAARYHGMQKLDRFNYSQQYIPDGYREILLPANEDGTHKLSLNTLHIWPRGRFMLIALPNFDGSYTCTLFMPFDDDKYCFNNLTFKEKVNEFFAEVFPDFYAMMPNIADLWEDHPLSSLAIIRCFPWTHRKLALMGDAAHATVPFFGQGMNAGFEDCSVMWSLMNQHMDNWPLIFKEYEKLRKPNGDAVQDLSLQNYIVMRDKVADPDFLLLQKIERRLNYLYPDSYFPLYSMVSFTNIEYATAFKKGNEQEGMLKQIIEENSITEATPEEIIDTILHTFIQKNTAL